MKMREEIAKLDPQRVWHYFLEITKIPRQSKHEEKIAQYLIDFAKKHQLAYVQDDTGNVVIKKAAGKKNESQRIVVLQSHIDMVCEKNEDVNFDFSTDAIEPYIDNGWVKAKGTTLGADDGIGVAAQLAILEMDDPTLPSMEHLFTVDEETGLTGAFGLDPTLLQGDILLNLDSEDKGQLFIGCAGGVDTTAELPFAKESIPAGYTAFKVKVFGLRGGHSGDEINKGLGNAVKLLARVLTTSAENYGLRVSTFNAGSAHNAIAREGIAQVIVPNDMVEDFNQYIKEMDDVFKKEYHKADPNASVECEAIQMPLYVIDRDTQNKLLYVLSAVIHGVLAMSQDIENFVETSSNLGVVKTKENHFLIINSHRSSVESAKENVKQMVAAAMHLVGAKVTHRDGYPGWNPNPNSEIVKITTQAYKDLFKTEPQVLAIHAGLECGLIGEKYPHMDMISFGPDIKGAHSPDERIEIDTVKDFWDLLLEVLRRIK